MQLTKVFIILALSYATFAAPSSYSSDAYCEACEGQSYAPIYSFPSPSHSSGPTYSAPSGHGSGKKPNYETPSAPAKMGSSPHESEHPLPYQPGGPIIPLHQTGSQPSYPSVGLGSSGGSGYSSNTQTFGGGVTPSPIGGSGPAPGGGPRPGSGGGPGPASGGGPGPAPGGGYGGGPGPAPGGGPGPAPGGGPGPAPGGGYGGGPGPAPGGGPGPAPGGGAGPAPGGAPGPAPGGGVAPGGGAAGGGGGAGAGGGGGGYT